jgi:acyl carrier protein
MNQTISQIIQTALDAQAPLLSVPIDTSQGEATPLFGPGSVLDSLGLVTLILNIEEMVEMQMGVAITIVSEKAMSAYRSPFATIGSLAEFITSLIQKKQHA